MKASEDINGLYAVRKHWDPFDGHETTNNLTFTDALLKLQEHFKNHPHGSVLVSIERQG